MTTIIVDQAVTVPVTLLTNGVPTPIASGATVTAQLFDVVTGAALFTPAITCLAGDAGSNWAAGLVAVALTALQTNTTAPPVAMLVVVVNGKPYRFRLDIEVANSAPTRSDLFVKDFIVSDIRSDQLYLLALTIMPNLTVTDDYIWDRVLAAESDASRRLRVRFVPTAFFPTPPTSDQITALNGMPWDIDPAYDYDPAMFQGDNWSFIQLRQRPLISLTSVMYNYPSENDFNYVLPLDWFKWDLKYGQLRIVPTSNISMAMLGGFMIQLIGAGRVIPHILNITYVAGLTDIWQKWPDIIDLIKKMAVVRVIGDMFFPSSGSISVDGLSQSLSVDMEKYRDMIDVLIDGPKGQNGGLKTAIHGVRGIVM